MKKSLIAAMLVLSSVCAWADPCPRIPAEEAMNYMTEAELRSIVAQYDSYATSGYGIDARNRCADESWRVSLLIQKKWIAEGEKKKAALAKEKADAEKAEKEKAASVEKERLAAIEAENKLLKEQVAELIAASKKKKK